MSQYTQLALRIWSNRGHTACPGSPLEADLVVLQEFATRMGRLIHKNRMFVKEPEGSDFVIAAPTYLYDRLGDFAHSFNAKNADGVGHTSGDPFAAWSRRVLNNHYIDIGRSQKRFHDRRGQFVQPQICEPQELVYGGGDGRFAVTAGEVQAMDSWNPTDRLIIVCILRCWDAVPQEMWQRWLSEAGQRQPFPPADFVAAPKGRERQQLGRALGMSRNAIDKRISRLKSL